MEYSGGKLIKLNLSILLEIAYGRFILIGGGNTMPKHYYAGGVMVWYPNRGFFEEEVRWDRPRGALFS